jgi:hypothetical protein
MEDKLSGPSGIEDGLERGRTVRYELLFSQVLHGARFGESGMQPYISATYDIDEANAYGEGILVIDLPESKIDNFGEKVKGETCIKGSLSKKYITSILIKDYKNYVNAIGPQKETSARKALRKLSGLIEVPLYTNEEIEKIQEEKYAANKKWDEEQLPKDLEAFYEYSVKRLIKLFPEVKMDLEGGITPLELRLKIQRDIFDYYANLIDIIEREVNGDKSSFEEKGYTFKDDRIRDAKDFENWNRMSPFNREKITDRMLTELRKFYEQECNYQLRVGKRK